MKRHELKTWPAYFASIRAGVKAFDLRLNDRGFAIGDILVLREFDPDRDAYTGEVEEREVTSILDENDRFGVMAGFVIMSLKPLVGPAAVHDSAPMPVVELLTWHESEARRSRERELTYDQAAERIDRETEPPASAVPGDRQRGLARAAGEIATFHEAAAATLRELGASA